MKIYPITKAKALELNMQIWNGNEEGVQYARIQYNTNRENPFYGRVFTIIN